MNLQNNHAIPYYVVGDGIDPTKVTETEYNTAKKDGTIREVFACNLLSELLKPETNIVKIDTKGEKQWIKIKK